MDGVRLRPATEGDVPRLRELVIAGVEHWGHHIAHPEAVAQLREHALPTAHTVETCPVVVLSLDGAVAGFYGLRLEDECVELEYMFVDPARIGCGLGRVLWEDAIETATALRPRLRIMSDPCAEDFYAAMGARLERRHEQVPGFFLSVMWCDLARPGTDERG